MSKRYSNRTIWTSPLSLFINLCLVYIAYALCRLAFLLENYQQFHSMLSGSRLTDMIRGGWMFDTSAILYTNALYALLMLLPLHYKEKHGYQKVTKYLFVVVNAICIVCNLADSVYFQYTGRRTTISVMQEFHNENNLLHIFGVEVLRHWYLVLLGVAMIYALWKFYYAPKGKRKIHPTWGYYVVQTIALALYIPLTICGMRGGATTAVRPITISNANQYVQHPYETAAVLNTPFALIRTFNKPVFTNPEYYTEKELDTIYSPLHSAESDSVSTPFRKKNVVVFIIESFGREYIGGMNTPNVLNDGSGKISKEYKSYTPFVDSLMQHGTTFLYTFSNGRKSIDGMPSILSSIPMFVEPFFLTPASVNDISGIAGELTHKGYQTAFFHGAENGSMGFEAFAKTTGFQRYFGRTEYDQDKRFNGDKDFDGTWAIWDEPFLQFYATKMSEMQQPFMTAVFTASSHHPYVIPEEYKDIYPEEEIVIHKCIRYTDNALRRFFATAKKMPWYKNTLFVITNDHTNLSNHEYYKTDLGVFCAPLLFFDPSGELQPTGMQDAIAQQIDIMPTVLNYLGYDRPYVAFGKDILHTSPEKTWAVNYINGIYQYIKGTYLLQWDGNKTTALYDFRKDSMLTHNLANKVPEQAAMERELKAIIQSYMTRMSTNNLTVKE